MTDPSVVPLAMQAPPLVVRFGRMGDMVILLTLIRALHERFGAPVDLVSSGSWTRPLLEAQPGVGTLYLIRARGQDERVGVDSFLGGVEFFYRSLKAVTTR